MRRTKTSSSVAEWVRNSAQMQALLIERGKDAWNRGVQLGDAELMRAGVDAMRLTPGIRRVGGYAWADVARAGIGGS